MSTATEAHVEADVLKTEIDTFCLEREALTITTDADLTKAESYLKECFEREKMINAHCDTNIKNAHALHKSLVAQKNAYLEPVLNLALKLKLAVGNWIRKKEQERQAAIRAQEDAARKTEEERRLIAAQEMQDQGEAELADEILEAPIVPLVQAPPPAPKAASVTLKKTYRFEITDPLKIPREYLCVDEVKIGKMVRASSGTLVIPGVRIIEEETAAKRRGF